MNKVELRRYDMTIEEILEEFGMEYVMIKDKHLDGNQLKVLVEVKEND